LSRRFPRLVVSPITILPTTAHVIIGGGGNLVENYYTRMANFIASLSDDQWLYICPSTALSH
jgi:hypothetical protein